MTGLLNKLKAQLKRPQSKRAALIEVAVLTLLQAGLWVVLVLIRKRQHVSFIQEAALVVAVAFLVAVVTIRASVGRISWEVLFYLASAFSLVLAVFSILYWAIDTTGEFSHRLTHSGFDLLCDGDTQHCRYWEYHRAQPRRAGASNGSNGG